MNSGHQTWWHTFPHTLLPRAISPVFQFLQSPYGAWLLSLRLIWDGEIDSREVTWVKRVTTLITQELGFKRTLPWFHSLVPLLGHGPVNDYLIPSPIWVHFSTISTFRSPEAHLNRDINGDTVKNSSQGRSVWGWMIVQLWHTSSRNHPAVQEKAQGKPFTTDTPTSILTGLPTHCVALAYNGLQTASTLQSVSTKAGLSKPYKGK